MAERDAPPPRRRGRSATSAGDEPESEAAVESGAGSAEPPLAVTAGPSYSSGLTTLRSAAVSATGRFVAMYGADALEFGIRLLDTQGELSRWIPTSRAPMTVRFTTDETGLAGALLSSDDGSAEVTHWLVARPDDRGTTVYSTSGVGGIAMSRDARTLVFRDQRAGLRVLDVGTGIAASIGHDVRYRKVAISPSGSLVCAAVDGTIEVYQRAAGADTNVDEPIHVFNTDFVQSMDCSDGCVVVASRDGVWVETANAGGRIIGPAPVDIRRIAVNSTGTVIAVGYESWIEFADLVGGSSLRVAAPSPVNRMTFSLDDRVLVTSHQDDMARLWYPPESWLGREQATSQAWGQAPGSEEPERDRVEWQPDSPASRDLLRREPLARALASRLRRFHEEEPHTSFLVHIDGPWGAGKSTLLNLLRQQLEHAPGTTTVSTGPMDWLTIDFNAWQQSRVGTPWWALLAALRANLGRNQKLRTRVALRIAESWARFRRTSAPFAAAVLAVLILVLVFFFILRPHKLTFGSSVGVAEGTTAVLAALGTLWAGAKVASRFLLWDSARGARLYEQSSLNPMQDIAQHFSWLIAKTKRPVVFFIDDLDRCTDSYVVELLETVQTLIRDAGTSAPGAGTSAPCFVVAADGAWIRRSFEIAYGQFKESVGEPGLSLGYLFLDKLFQLRVPVPTVDPVRQLSYIKELLRERDGFGSAGPDLAAATRVRAELANSSTEADVVRVLRSASPEVRDAVAGTAVDKLSAPALAAATEHHLQRFAPLLSPNPRAMKRFVNDYSILRAVRIIEGIPVGVDPLALWAIIETRWPGLADCLRAHPDVITLVDRPDKPPRQLTEDALRRVPADLRDLLTDLEVRRLKFFSYGGELTPELIAECCGADPESGGARWRASVAAGGAASLVSVPAPAPSQDQAGSVPTEAAG